MVSNHKSTAIVLVSDFGYIDYACFLTYMLRKFDSNLGKVYVLTDGVDNIIFDKKFEGIEAIQIPVEMAKIRSLGVIPQGHVTVSAYAKILIPEILPKEISHAVYLDIDVLPLRSIRPLMEFPMHKAIAATQFANGESRILFGTDDATYFSSGILKLDLDRWRENKYSDQLVQLLSRNPRLHYGEQDLLNMYFKENWQLLPPSFNFMAELSLNAHLWDKAISPLLVHLVGSRKPWTVRGHTKWHELWRQEYLLFSSGRDARELTLANSDLFIYRFVMGLSRFKCMGIINQMIPKIAKNWIHRFGEKRRDS